MGLIAGNRSLSLLDCYAGVSNHDQLRTTEGSGLLKAEDHAVVFRLIDRHVFKILAMGKYNFPGWKLPDNEPCGAGLSRETSCTVETDAIAGILGVKDLNA